MLTAGDRSTPQSDSALEQLCKTYWFPLYAYVRRRGYIKEDAEDLTQAFFARFLAKNYLGDLSAGRGRFRAFLLASLKHFLANEWDKAQRQKRGGGEVPLSLDWQTADTKFQIATTNEESPDKAFDREWALALLSSVVERLQKECEDDGRGNLFEKLKTFLTADTGKIAQADVAKELNMDETAVRVAIHRLRKRYRQLLRAEIMSTLSDGADVNEELRALFKAFGG